MKKQLTLDYDGLFESCIYYLVMFFNNNYDYYKNRIWNIEP